MIIEDPVGGDRENTNRETAKLWLSYRYLKKHLVTKISNCSYSPKTVPSIPPFYLSMCVVF